MDGSRRPKDDVAFHALGAVDEAQVTIGVCRSLIRENLHSDGAYRGGAYRGGAARRRNGSKIKRLEDDLARIQFDLIIAGGALSTTFTDQLEETMPRIDDISIGKLTKTFEWWRGQVDIEPKFVIAGDSRLGAEFDRARTVVRRAERHVVRLVRERGNRDQIPVSRYLNQLSDLCFVLARWCDSVL